METDSSVPKKESSGNVIEKQCNIPYLLTCYEDWIDVTVYKIPNMTKISTKIEDTSLLIHATFEPDYKPKEGALSFEIWRDSTERIEFDTVIIHAETIKSISSRSNIQIIRVYKQSYNQAFH